MPAFVKLGSIKDGSFDYSPSRVEQLRRLGVSPLGAEQALKGQVVLSPDDRAQLARLLAYVLKQAQAGGNVEFTWKIESGM